MPLPRVPNPFLTLPCLRKSGPIEADAHHSAAVSARINSIAVRFLGCSQHLFSASAHINSAPRFASSCQLDSTPHHVISCLCPYISHPPASLPKRIRSNLRRGSSDHFRSLPLQIVASHTLSMPVLTASIRCCLRSIRRCLRSIRCQIASMPLHIPSAPLHCYAYLCGISRNCAPLLPFQPTPLSIGGTHSFLSGPQYVYLVAVLRLSAASWA